MIGPPDRGSNIQRGSIHSARAAEYEEHEAACGLLRVFMSSRENLPPSSGREMMASI